MILAIKIAFGLFLLAAALQDMRELRIGNWISIALLALYPLWIFATQFEPDIWQNAVLCVATFAIGTLLFAMRWLGGGDVKLLAAIALWFDFSAAPSLLLFIAIGGGVLVLVLVPLRRLLPRAVHKRSQWKVLQPSGPIPYGLAIAIGAVLCSLSPGFNPHVRPLTDRSILKPVFNLAPPKAP